MGRSPSGRDDTDFVEYAEAARARLRRTAYLICGDWDRASDVVQEALIRVYVAWPRIERRDGVNAYARRCVVNVAIDQGRKRSSGEVPTEHHRMDHPVAGGEADHGIPRRDAMLQALRDLAPKQRACVVLRFFEDLSVAETARILRCSEGTVKSQTSRALDTLRRHPTIRELVPGSADDTDLISQGALR